MLAFVFVTSGLAVSPSVAHETSGKPLLVGMGDSYTSGYGLPPYEPDSVADECFRSQKSFPVLAADMLGFDVKNVACSAAKPEDFIAVGHTGEPAQASQIAGADYVAFTIGGMSVGGPRGILESAVSADATAEYQRELERLRPMLLAAYQAVHRAAPRAKLFALGYPDIAPDGKTSLVRCVGLQAVGIDVDLIHQNVAALNATIAEVASSAGVTFVPTTPSFAGHDICSREPYAFSPRAATARGVEPDGVLHPNAAGARQLADDLVAAIQASRGADSATPTAASPVSSPSPVRAVIEQSKFAMSLRTSRAKSTTI